LVYPASQFHASGKWLADLDLMVYSTNSSIADQSYSEVSLDVDPTTAQLAQLGKSAKSADLVPDLQLPASYETPALKKLAQEHAGGQDTEIGQVDALANWLSGPRFSYNLGAALFDSADGLQTFLTKSKTGFCVQSAYAMTVLARLLDIPARFVVGYTSGTRVKNGTYRVMNTDAHAWTEVYFPTIGWLRFEPTPSGQGTAHATNYMGSATGTGQLSPDPVITATGTPGQQNSSQSRNQLGRTHDQPGARYPVSSAPGRSAGTPWAAVALAVIAAIVLAGASIVRIALRRWRWLRAHDDTSRAHAAWREFRDDLTDYGITCPASEPPRTLAARVTSGLTDPASQAIRRLALAEERARYAASPSGSRTLHQDGATARRALAASAGTSARWRARIFPASVMTVLADWRRARGPTFYGRPPADGASVLPSAPSAGPSWSVPRRAARRVPRT
jgi:transglutaminase-like putative cysteine protease